jgi:hypothetical protein
MAWNVNDEEFEAVSALPASGRYAYFIKRAASHGELWGLRGADGWVVAVDDDGNQHFPVWPHPRFAEACAEGPWKGETPVAIDIDEWVHAWLPDLEKDGMRVAVFQRPDDEGVGVGAQRLKSDLEEELAQFEL